MTGLHNGVEMVAITGAHGFLGRWLALAWTAQGVKVLALMRGAQGRLDELRQWVDARGGRGALIEAASMELGDADRVGLDDETLVRLEQVDVFYHLAASYAFGLSREQAYLTNVQASVRLVELMAQRGARLRRFVLLSGYRASAPAAASLDVEDAAALDRFYRDHGAYEASKIEAHHRVERAALRCGLPLTRVSPAVVIGDSRTGETTQIIGFAETIEQLWLGQLPALVGSAQVWLPLVTVDFVAQVLVASAQDEGPSQHLVVFDERSPLLEALVKRAATRLGMKAPSRYVSAGLLKALPQSMTGVEPETLSFLSEDRYDARPLTRFNAKHGLTMPKIDDAFDRWVDHLVDTRFGRSSGQGGALLEVNGERAFVYGARDGAKVVLLHGLLLSGRSWSPVAKGLAGEVYVAPDLPGLGSSAPTVLDMAGWVSGLLASAQERVILVGHSLGCAFAVAYAQAYPERVAGLVLISPAFLQPRAGWAYRQPWLLSAMLRWGDDAALATRLGQAEPAQVQDSLYLLKRAQVRRASARWLAEVSAPAARQRSQAALSALSEVPTMVIVGDQDPLSVAPPIHVRVEQLQGAGHYVQLEQPEQVAALIREFGAVIEGSSRSGSQAPHAA